MPLYEYSCSDCGHRFEVLQRMGEGSEGLKCPNCASAGVSKQLSTFAPSSGNGSGETARAQPGCGPSGYT